MRDSGWVAEDKAFQKDSRVRVRGKAKDAQVKRALRALLLQAWGRVADPDRFVIERVKESVSRYLRTFDLKGTRTGEACHA